MRHKIEVWSEPLLSGLRLWYVRCSCRWEPGTPVEYAPGGPSYFGRSTFRAALAAGAAHQQDTLYLLTRSHSA